MSAQIKYGYKTQIGIAGGLVDITDYAIDAYANEEETGTMKFGVGVVAGSTPGKTIMLPTEDATADDFIGITNNGHTTEHDLEGATYIRQTAAVGVLLHGRIYARVATDVEPAYWDKAYLITSGDEVGYFTNESGDNTIDVKARFLGPVDTTAQIAPVILADNLG